MLCDFFFRLRAWEIHAKTGALASRSTIVMNTSVFVFKNILDSTAMVSLSCRMSQILSNQSRLNYVNLCHVWKFVKNLTQKWQTRPRLWNNSNMNHELTLLLVEVFYDDESAKESVSVVNKPVIHFFLPLWYGSFKFTRWPLKASMLSFFVWFVLFFSISLIFISSLNSSALRVLF